ncbi:MAG: cytochrome C oxidase subunit IV family protein [Armatimonadetes bacterium]|nr:cytochrome C oxidase subunit IV family protein [Armatimonadota bacterium]MDW8028670.1 cytochrome C oxidase subunit IV family protein [Armatimonadota bacterium]
MAHAEQKHPQVKVYLTVWFWLFVLSFSAYFVDLMKLPFALKAVLLVAIALMKAGLIAAYFMHLRFEKLNLVYTIVLPLILLIALAAGVMPDGLSVLMNR